MMVSWSRRWPGRLLAAGCSALFPFIPTAVAVASPHNEPVIVTATRTAQTADELLAPVIVIDRGELERLQAADLGEVLRLHAGLDLGRNGGPGQATSLFLRGTDSNHTLVLIDGVRMNPATIGGAAVHHLDPEVIERVEIVKGPRSTLYGSDAIGGVINIITRRASAGQEVDAAGSAGSHGSRRASGGFEAARGTLRYGIRLSQYDARGYAPLVASPLVAGHDRFTLAAHAEGTVGPVEAGVRHFRAAGTTAYVDSFTLARLDQDFLNSVTAVSAAFQPHDHWLSSLRLSEARDEIDQHQSEDFAHTRRLAVDWQNDIQIGEAQLWTAGVELMQERADVVNFGDGFRERRDISAIYLQDTVELGVHRLLLAARHTRYEGFGEHLTWDGGYGIRLSERTRLTAGVGTAFRAPDQTDRFGFGGNPDLDPETSANREVGIRHRFPGNHDVGLQLFQNDIRNLIEFDFVGTGGMTNLGRARIRGLELSHGWVSGPWRLRSEAVVQSPRLRSGGQLPRRARRTLAFSLVHDAARWQAGADVLLTSARRDSEFSDAELSGYGLLNLSGLVRLGSAWSLRGRVENLFDRDYRLADGYQTGGREIRVEVAWRHGP